jgi:hypothetical protein
MGRTLRRIVWTRFFWETFHFALKFVKVEKKKKKSDGLFTP